MVVNLEDEDIFLFKVGLQQLSMLPLHVVTREMDNKTFRCCPSQFEVTMKYADKLQQTIGLIESVLMPCKQVGLCPTILGTQHGVDI